MHFMTLFLHRITSENWLSRYFVAASKVGHGRHLFLFLTDASLYVAPCLQFRGDNSINAAKACISNSGLFVWEICIIKLMCRTAERRLTLYALLRWQNEICIHFKTRPLPHQQDVLIVFSWQCFRTVQCHFIANTESCDFCIHITFKLCSLKSQWQMIGGVFLSYTELIKF